MRSFGRLTVSPPSARCERAGADIDDGECALLRAEFALLELLHTILLETWPKNSEMMLPNPIRVH
jgi:hypothetical protein